MSSFPKKRTHVIISDELVKTIDGLVGKRKRSQFITEAAMKEVTRLRLLQALRETSGVWKARDHPELREGAAKWVRKLRQDDEKRWKRVVRG